MINEMLQKLLGVHKADEETAALKQKSLAQIEATTVTIRKANKLQAIVVKKTTTYYLAKAMGTIK